jgi:hypothetical protein
MRQCSENAIWTDPVPTDLGPLSHRVSTRKPPSDAVNILKAGSFMEAT